jgi:hypothetical protein
LNITEKLRKKENSYEFLKRKKIFTILTVLMFMVLNTSVIVKATTPTSGTTTFDNLDGYFISGSAGDTKLTANNFNGYDFDFYCTGFNENTLILVEKDGSSNVETVDALSDGAQVITSMQCKANSGQIFDLKSIGVVMNGANAGFSGGNVQLIGYRNGSPVAGAILTQSVTDIYNGGSVAIFDVSTNSAFIGIDKFSIQGDAASPVYGLLGIGNINANNFRNPTSAPTLAATTAATPVGATTATTGGNVTADGGATVIDRGVVYGTSSGQQIGTGTKVQISTIGTGTYSINLTGLTPSTTYYVRSYATNSVGTSYGSEISFTTAAKTATIAADTGMTEENLDARSLNVTLGGDTFKDNTLSASNFTLNNAPAGTSIESVSYTDSTHCTINLAYDGADFDTNISNFSVTIGAAELTGGQAITSNNLSITAIVETVPTLAATTAATSVRPTTATIGGNVTADGGEVVTDRGVVYGTSSGPQIGTGTKVAASTATGTYSIGLTGLVPSTTYYVRSYATNSVGTSYGSEISFTTAAPNTTKPGTSGTLSFAMGDADLQYDQQSSTRTIGGQEFTLSALPGNVLAYDDSQGAGGIFVYDGGASAGVNFTITVNNGYMFDIDSFEALASDTSVSYVLTYADGTTSSGTLNGVSTSGYSTLSPTITNIKQIVLTSVDYAVFQNFAIANITAIQAPDTTKPVITLNGSASVTVENGAVYTDAGATVTDNKDTGLTATATYKKDGASVLSINTSVAGTYTVYYNVSDAAGNAALEVTRTVVVKEAPDTTKPVIMLNGSASVTVENGATYTDAGATVTDNKDTGLTATVTYKKDGASVSGIDTSVAGTYTVYYNVSDAAGNAALEVTRTVVVKEAPDTTKPVITLNGSASVTVENGATYTDAGATVTDNKDTGLTATVTYKKDGASVSGIDTSVAGTYTIYYNVSDAAGNAAIEVTRTVVVKEAPDTTKPVITLVGSASVTVENGAVYTDAGATVTDNKDTGLTATVTYTKDGASVSSIDTSVAGTYTIHYNVSDAAGNAAVEVTRTVVVKAQEIPADTIKPVITLSGSASVTVENGATYTDAGATVTDNKDTGLTATVTYTKDGASVSGIDTAVAGTYTIHYNVSDAAGNAAVEVTRTVVVKEATEKLTINKTNPTDVKQGEAYSYTFQATGGTGIKIFQITAGALPEGLTLASNGTLSGVTTSSAISAFTVTVKDSASPAQTDSSSFIMNILKKLSQNAKLAGLTISNAILNETFNGATNSYTANVAHGVSSIKITPVVSDTDATVKVNGTLVINGQSSADIGLSVGDNKISIIVIAEDGTTNEYVVTVTRASKSSSNSGGSTGTSSSGTSTNSTSGSTANATTVQASVVNNSTGESVQKAEAKVSTEADGTKTVTVKSQEAIVLKQADGTRNSLSDFSKLSFAKEATTGETETGKAVLSSDGVIQVKNLANGTDSNFKISYDLGNGQKIVIGTMKVNVSESGQVNLTNELIDPYGIITDTATGKIIPGANVTLYYANTERNKANGKTPDKLVELPLIDGFKPNNNKDPQISDANGEYGFMVFPTTDYYLVATKDGYDKYVSPTISVEQEIVKWDFKMIATNTVKEAVKVQSFSADKAIEIVFNHDLKESTIDSNSIYVEDSKNNKVETVLKYDANSKKVTVTPVKSYSVGQNYTLYVTKNLLSTNDKSMDQAVKYKFSIKSSDAATEIINTGKATENNAKKEESLVTEEMVIKKLEEAKASKKIGDYNETYAMAVRLPINKQEYYLDELSKLASEVYTSANNEIINRLQVFAASANLRDYEALIVEINDRIEDTMDRAYFLGELTHWGKELVYTPEVLKSVRLIIDAYSKRTVQSLYDAYDAVETVDNVESRIYLREQLWELAKNIDSLNILYFN